MVNTPATTSSRSRSQVAARASFWVGVSLIGLFILNLVGNFLPPKLLDPDWQLNLSDGLINSGIYPLMGLLLVIVSAYLEPDNSTIDRWQTRLRSLACLATAAYLLLAPAVVLICKLGLDRSANVLDREYGRARQQIVDMRAAINTSPNLAALQARFQQLKAPPLPLDAASLPYSEIQGSLLDQLKANERNLQQNLRQPLLIRMWPLLQRAYRNILASLVLAVGFASMAKTKSANQTLLQAFAATFRGLGNFGGNFGSRFQKLFKRFRKDQDKLKRLATAEKMRKQAQQESRKRAKQRSQKARKQGRSLNPFASRRR